MGVFAGPSNFSNVGADPSLVLNFATKKSLNDLVSGNNLITFERASTGTYVGSDGLIKTAAADEARFDHDPETGESLGLLIEESRSNLLLQSQNFTTSWSDNYNDTTVVSNAIISPDGTLNGSKIIKDSGSSISNLISNNTGIISPSRAMFSIYAKAGGFDGIQLTSWADPNDFQNFDLVNGTLGNAGSVTPLVNSKITYVGNQWYRCLAYLKPSGNGGLGFQPTANPQSDGWRPTNSGNGVDGIYVWGAQIEAGSFPTSYIPTSGSTFTRQPDNASITGTNFTDFYNQSEWTMFCEYSSFSFSNSASLPTLAHFTDGTLNEYVRLNCAPSYKLRSFIVDGGVTQTQINTGGTSSNNEIVRSVAGIQENNVKIVVNGNTSNVATNVTLPNPTKVEIGNWILQANTFLNGYISQLIYYPARISDIKLEQMTKNY